MNGNFFVNEFLEALWETPSECAGCSYLSLTTTGDLQLINKNTQDVEWHSNTQGNGASTLTLHDDGNLVLTRNSDSKVSWMSNTHGSFIYSPSNLVVGDFLLSSNGLYKFVFDVTGFLQVVQLNTNTYLFSQELTCRIDRKLSCASEVISLTTDGNVLEVISGGQAFHKILFDTNTGKNGAAAVKILDSGNVVLLKDSDEEILWQTNTHGSSLGSNSVLYAEDFIESSNTLFIAKMDPILGFVILDVSNPIIPRWTASGSQSCKTCYLSLDKQGNLAVYDTNGNVKWQTSTNGDELILTLGTDGNLSLMNSSKQTVWNTSI